MKFSCIYNKMLAFIYGSRMALTDPYFNIADRRFLEIVGIACNQILNNRIIHISVDRIIGQESFKIPLEMSTDYRKRQTPKRAPVGLLYRFFGSVGHAALLVRYFFDYLFEPFSALACLR